MNTKITIRKLSSRAAGFNDALDKLLAFEATQDETLEATVAGILADVRKRGDAAVLEYTRKPGRTWSRRSSSWRTRWAPR